MRPLKMILEAQLMVQLLVYQSDPSCYFYCSQDIKKQRDERYRDETLVHLKDELALDQSSTCSRGKAYTINYTESICYLQQ
ncbi:uncharacterized protein LOC122296098 isoform X3 [Carya illinoinensis]|uniref:uncharacterized protein LOC122296098 isoform X3 n=1 Tax=Carya illinoinensis TaxID=32201 RepID=UPI001C721698|nr:uncharacterized protein LOC122296098 isoform X3 [Carya illinoinensis]